MYWNTFCIVIYWNGRVLNYDEYILDGFQCCINNTDNYGYRNCCETDTKVNIVIRHACTSVPFSFHQSVNWQFSFSRRLLFCLLCDISLDRGIFLCEGGLMGLKIINNNLFWKIYLNFVWLFWAGRSRLSTRWLL